MTPEERNLLLHGFFSRPNPVNKLPQIGAPFAAGYTPGIARLGIPQLAESDASLGVAWINGKRARDATALPSSLALAATWDMRIAYAGSAAIAQDARASGLNVLLAGGVESRHASRAMAAISNIWARTRCWPEPWRARPSARFKTSM